MSLGFQKGNLLAPVMEASTIEEISELSSTQGLKHVIVGIPCALLQNPPGSRRFRETRAQL